MESQVKQGLSVRLIFCEFHKLLAHKRFQAQFEHLYAHFEKREALGCDQVIQGFN